MDFELHYKKYAPLKSLLYYTTVTCQKFGFALLSILRCFGRREDIFFPFLGILAGSRLFKSFEFRNGSSMSDEKLVILKFKYLQNKKWLKQAVKSTRIKRNHRTY